MLCIIKNCHQNIKKCIRETVNRYTHYITIFRINLQSIYNSNFLHKKNKNKNKNKKMTVIKFIDLNLSISISRREKENKIYILEHIIKKKNLQKKLLFQR